MKKTILTVILVMLISLTVPVSEARAVGTSAASSILMDAGSLEVLYENNADTRMRIASTTKILTALIVLENCKLDDMVKIAPESVGVEGSSMYLRADEQLTVLELLYGLMLSSGNDAAVALAYHTAGSIADFAELMNAKAKSLSCENSNFVNPHGLDADGHYSTARDLAKITAVAVQNKTFCEIVSTKNISIAGRALENHNKLLWRYEGVIGVKTGYTKSAGRSLVTCAERDAIRLICVTLSDPDDWDDHSALYDWAFSEFKTVAISKNEQKYITLPVISGLSGFVNARPAFDFSIICKKSDTVEIAVEAPRFVYAGVIRGARAGVISITKNGEPVAEIPLVFCETVNVDETIRLSAWEKIKWAWYFANSRGGTPIGGIYSYPIY